LIARITSSSSQFIKRLGEVDEKGKKMALSFQCQPKIKIIFKTSKENFLDGKISFAGNRNARCKSSDAVVATVCSIRR
jgi:hypothetical protein